MYFAILDVVRGLLAWTVVAAHLIWYTGIASAYPKLGFVNKAAHVAVLEFIIISGFVITNLVLREQVSYVSYLGRRFYRIYPVYFLCLLAGIATTLLSFQPFETLWPPESLQAHDLHAVRESLWSGFPEHLLAHLLLVQGLISDKALYYSQMMFLAPAWSLSLEWQFYVIAPFVIRFMRVSSGIRTYAVVGIALAGQALYANGVFGEFALPSLLPAAAAFFVLGILTRLQLSTPISLKSIRPDLVLLLIGMLFLKLPVAPLIIWFGLTLGMIEFRNRIIERLSALSVLRRCWGLLRELGLRSYSTYLIHLPLLQIVICFGVLLGLKPWQICSLELVIAVPATLICSHLLYKYVEQPAMLYGAQLFDGSMRSATNDPLSNLFLQKSVDAKPS